MIDKTKPILVLGAFGRLGKQTTILLEKSGYTNILFPMRNECDLLNPYSYETYFHAVKPNYIINLAGKTTNINLCNHYPASISRETLLMNTTVLEMAKKYQVEKVINIISSCAYDGSGTLLREEDFWDGAPHKSILAHGLAKRMVYFLGNSYAKQYKMNVVSIAMNNLFGCGDWSRPTSLKFLDSLIVKIVDAKLLKYKTVELWGTGKPYREVLYTKDASIGLIKVLEEYDDPDLLNIGTGEDMSIAEYAKLIAEVVGWKGTFVYNTEKPDGQMVKRFSVDNMRAKLDWSPPTNVRQAIKEVVDDYKEFSKNQERRSYRLA